MGSLSSSNAIPPTSGKVKLAWEKEQTFAVAETTRKEGEAEHPTNVPEAEDIEVKKSVSVEEQNEKCEQHSPKASHVPSGKTIVKKEPVSARTVYKLLKAEEEEVKEGEHEEEEDIQTKVTNE